MRILYTTRYCYHMDALKNLCSGTDTKNEQEKHKGVKKN